MVFLNKCKNSAVLTFSCISLVESVTSALYKTQISVIFKFNTDFYTINFLFVLMSVKNCMTSFDFVFWRNCRVLIYC